MIKEPQAEQVVQVPARSVYVMFCPNRGVPEGQVCGWSARAEWPVWGSRGTVLLEAAGAPVVALAGRRSWFCYHQVFAVLPRLGRRTGLADVAALGRAFSWARACGC